MSMVPNALTPLTALASTGHRYDIHVTEREGKAVVMAEVDRQSLSAVLHSMTHVPDAPTTSITMDDSRDLRQASYGEETTHEKKKNAFMLFPSEIVYQLKKVAYWGTTWLVFGVGFYFARSYFGLTNQALIMWSLIYWELTALFFLLHISIRFYLSSITHDYDGEVEIANKYAWYRPARVTIASNVIRAVARYDSVPLSLFDVGHLFFHDASKELEKDMFWISDPKFWVKVYKLHA